MKQLLFSFLVLLMSTSLTLAQRTVSGKVTDAAGESVIGASVFVKEAPGVGTITDIDGVYQLNVPANGNTLVFSYTGFETFEAAITSGTVNVTMQEGKLLDEVVVTGYGTQIKSRLTGNIAKVSGKDIANAPVTSLEGALQGRAAGVFIEANNGKVGSANRMRIRGASSIGASNQPLFVVDGIIISTETLNGTGEAINPLTDINPNDIESVEILKDASAAAIYGARGTNGVVIITTKQGKKGESKINLNVQYGSSSPTNKREFMNSEEFIQFFREAAQNSDIYEDDNFWVGFTEGRFDRYSGHTGTIENDVFKWVDQPTDTDWQDQAFRRGNNMMADLSFQGGNDKTTYYASTSYNKTEGILIGNDFERFGARLNLDTKAKDWLDVGVKLNLSRTSIDQVAADNAFSTPMQLVALAPINPIRDPNGQLYDTPVTTYYNGLIEQEYASRNIFNTRMLANGYMSFKLTDKLRWRNEVSYDLFNLKENARWGQRTEVGRARNGEGYANYGQTNNVMSSSYFIFDTKLNDIKLNAVGGIEFQRTRVDRANVSGREFPLDDLKTLASAAEIFAGTSLVRENSFVSYFARTNFEFFDRFLFTLSGRVDGSSRFGTNNRYGFFPATSLGYIITNEEALANSDFLSFLKFRVSYGLTGNAAIGDYDHLGLYNPEPYNNRPGLIPSRIANPDLRWEKTGQFDVGFDYGFFNNRITGEIDFYQKNTTDLILAVPVPATSGFSTQAQNIGAVRNRGVELVINTINTTGALKWSTGFNFAFNRNEVTKLFGEQNIIDEGSSRWMNVVQVGQPIGVFYGAEYAGVDPANGDALWYLNSEEDPRGTTNDYSEANFTNLGNPTPEYIGGITNSLSYKGFDLNFTFQGVFGNMIHLAGDPFMACNGCWFDNQTRDQLRAWKQLGDITDIPQARLGLSNGDQGRSSRYLSDGSYLRLRNIVFSYNLPKSMLKQKSLDNVRIFVQGQNLLTFTKYIGWDPEVSSDFAVSNVRSGIEFYSAPQPRTITFGLNIGL